MKDNKRRVILSKTIRVSKKRIILSNTIRWE